MAAADEGYHREISETLADFFGKIYENEIRKKIRKKGYSVLVVGLGNREVTPDALGPYVVDQLNVTRHIVQEYGRYAVGKRRKQDCKCDRSGSDGTDRDGVCRNYTGNSK